MKPFCILVSFQYGLLGGFVRRNSQIRLRAFPAVLALLVSICIGSISVYFLADAIHRHGNGSGSISRLSAGLLLTFLGAFFFAFGVLYWKSLDQ